MILSKRVSNLSYSPIRKLADQAQDLIDSGFTIYQLNIGQPEIKTPQAFFDALAKHGNQTLRYSNSRGESILLDSIQNFYKKQDIHISKSDMIITNGASEALLFVFQSICDPGDEILAPEPIYANTVSFLKFSGVNIKTIPTTEDTGYHLPDQKVIESLITPKTKAIMITNPNNPTGTVYTQEEIEMLKDIAIKHDLFLIGDEVYNVITFDDVLCESLLFTNRALDHIIIIDSISKRYSSCGARIGCVISKNSELMENMLKLAQARLSVSVLNQIGASALYDLDFSYFESIKENYQRKRDITLSLLSTIPNIKYSRPEGAFYILVTMDGINAEDFTKWLLTSFSIDNKTVLLSPATGFYLSDDLGSNQIRIAYILDDESLIDALTIFKEGLKTYRKLNM